VIRVLLSAICLVLAGLVLTACADSNKRSEDNKFGGFYGGINGGVAP
jgi:hypothetical protein